MNEQFFEQRIVGGTGVMEQNMVENVKFMKLAYQQCHTCNNCVTIYILNLYEYAVMQKIANGYPAKQKLGQVCS